MRVLITGVAGFIGFHIANNLLKNKKNRVYGLDNLDDYYSISLKKKRIDILSNNKKFDFLKLDLKNKKKLFDILKNKKIDFIFHFAAQAGVRYTATNPNKYILNNILAFSNMLQLNNFLKVKKFFYASSSSVYGDSNIFPSSEESNLKPKNIYGLSKKFNEEISDIYVKHSNTRFIGLRFFTVYGEWGRPDMLLIKFFNFANSNRVFQVNNYGNHFRDFTYINDVVKIIEVLIKKKINKKHTILNICSSRPLKLIYVINKLSKITSFKKIKKIKLNDIEVLRTYGDNTKLKRIIKNFKFTKFETGLKNTYDWFFKFKNLLR